CRGTSSAAQIPITSTTAGIAQSPACPPKTAAAVPPTSGTTSDRASEINRTVISLGETGVQVTSAGSNGVVAVMGTILALRRCQTGLPVGAAPDGASSSSGGFTSHQRSTTSPTTASTTVHSR